ncbi:tetratricopeptide repeat protein [Clostridium sediminicola]|uniref:tetratricopeptide repeat protein n=1 Tax=Clostridium sediminicola TaxID=3114879 RepID=UPI0031F24AE1
MKNFEKGNLFYNNKKYYEAIENYKKALIQSENNTTILYNIGVCFIKLEKYFDAIEFFKKAITSNNNLNLNYNSKYFYNLGFCYSKLNNNKKALIYFNTAWALDNFDNDCKEAIDLILRKYPKT